jgi:hypothetical protein
MLPFEILLLCVFTSGLVLQRPGTINPSLETSVQHQHKQSILAQIDPSTANANTYTYKCYTGRTHDFPPPSQWLSYTDLWNINREQILSSNAGDTYLQDSVHECITTVAMEAHINMSVILALILQESQGRVDGPCKGLTPDCGILNVHKGSHFDAKRPQSSILQMIRQGIEGDAKRGLGFAEYVRMRPELANEGDVFVAARAFDSDGVVGENLNVVKGKGSAGYVNDFANRLMGWDGTGNGFDMCH